MTIENLAGLIPDALTPKSSKIFFDRLEVIADIGFHDIEIGVGQRVILSIEIWLDDAAFASDDAVQSAWNYDNVRSDAIRIAHARRYNLQETLVREIYQAIAARHGVKALRISTCKPDIYPDCGGVGVELASF
jgi:7,8-dihydroneopterin aldolase/epimerase/oxygenase